jgi:hypothetical protein
MSKLKWTKLTRFGTDVHWFSGIYKISPYTSFRGRTVKRYYQVYVLLATNWGDFVIATQRNRMPTFSECRAIAYDHHRQNGQPHHSRLKAAGKAIIRHMEPQAAWEAKQK